MIYINPYAAALAARKHECAVHIETRLAPLQRGIAGQLTRREHQRRKAACAAPVLRDVDLGECTGLEQDDDRQRSRVEQLYREFRFVLAGVYHHQRCLDTAGHRKALIARIRQSVYAAGKQSVLGQGLRPAAVIKSSTIIATPPDSRL